MASAMTLAAISDYVSWWQWILLLVLIALILFWVMYRRKQM